MCYIILFSLKDQGEYLRCPPLNIGFVLWLHLLQNPKHLSKAGAGRSYCVPDGRIWRKGVWRGICFWSSCQFTKTSFLQVVYKDKLLIFFSWRKKSYSKKKKIRNIHAMLLINSKSDWIRKIGSWLVSWGKDKKILTLVLAISRINLRKIIRHEIKDIGKACSSKSYLLHHFIFLSQLLSEFCQFSELSFFPSPLDLWVLKIEK